jgi:hypothetical protein
MYSMNDRQKKIAEKISSTDWHKCKGIIANECETNSSLAKRDYSVKCDAGVEPLMVIGGYWFWWCWNHHQPLSWCDKGKIEQLINDNCLVMINKKDGVE